VSTGSKAWLGGEPLQESYIPGVDVKCDDVVMDCMGPVRVFSAFQRSSLTARQDLNLLAQSDSAALAWNTVPGFVLVFAA